MSESVAITETCSCGGTFAIASKFAVDARRAAQAWREGHKHAESVGICADMPPMAGPDGFAAPLCVLKAGHTGAHGDGNGGHWSGAPTTTPTPPVRDERGSDE